MKIVVTGASGLVGSALVPALEARGHDVLRLVRRAPSGASEVSWDPEAGSLDATALDGADAIVNVSGENIGKRWTESRKREILDSRVQTTDLLARTAASLERRPRVFVCASAVGYYGDRGDEILTETAESGGGFLAEVCRAWEAAAAPAREAGIRVANLRQGLVLAGGGVLDRMRTPFKLGVGGRVGSGKQWWSWIAIDDLTAGYAFVLEGDLEGAVNLTSPNPVTNAQFTRALGQALGRPTVFPLPAFAARAAFGEMGEEMLLGGQRVLPARLLDAGFEFGRAELEQTLRTTLGK